MKLGMEYVGKSVGIYSLLASKKDRMVPSPSLVLMLGFIATTLEAKILAPGSEGARLFSLFNIILWSQR